MKSSYCRKNKYTFSVPDNNIFVYFRTDRVPDMVVKVLGSIEPKIQKEDIAHALSKLKNHPNLESYLVKHMEDRLYLLQFRKCEDETCCHWIVPDLHPYVPAPILQPNGEQYVKSQDLYGKVETTERYCPSLMANESRSRKQEGFKYLASPVAATLKCSLCNKPCCIYSMLCSLGVTVAQLLEDFIYSCGASLPSKILYTSPEMICKGSVERTHY